MLPLYLYSIKIVGKFQMLRFALGDLSPTSAYLRKIPKTPE